MYTSFQIKYRETTKIGKTMHYYFYLNLKVLIHNLSILCEVVWEIEIENKMGLSSSYKVKYSWVSINVMPQE
jgi:hypothetical protein